MGIEKITQNYRRSILRAFAFGSIIYFGGCSRYIERKVIPNKEEIEAIEKTAAPITSFFDIITLKIFTKEYQDRHPELQYDPEVEEKFRKMEEDGKLWLQRNQTTQPTTQPSY